MERLEPIATGNYLIDNWDYLRKLGATANPLLTSREMAFQLRAWRSRILGLYRYVSATFRGGFTSNCVARS